MALTPISPFRPRRFRGALLPDTATVAIEVLDADRRPVAAVADHYEVRFVQRVDVHMERKIQLRKGKWRRYSEETERQIFESQG